MSSILHRKAFLISSLALTVTAGNAAAGGFEKATLWDARYSALGGAAVSSVNNSSAVFFNPAGLAFAISNDIALHASPTVTQASGPVQGDDTYVAGEDNFSPSGGLTGLQKLNDRLTLGYGVYATGGAAATFKDVEVGAGNLVQTGDYSTDMYIVEAGLALACRINDNWSVAGTFRITYAMADINLASDVDFGALGTGSALIGYNDLSGFDYFGVRLGAMYRSDDNRWGWGINYRSGVEVEADGNTTYSVSAPLNQGFEGTGDAKAKTRLPMQISSGFDYQLTENWRLFQELTYTNYKAIDAIEFEEETGGNPVTEITTNWNDQFNIRFAGEYTGIEGWSLRGGYILTTAVVPEGYATPSFSTPAIAHTLTMGAGTTCLDGKLDLDIGAEYNYVKNENVVGGGNVTDSTTASSGKYRTSAYAFHLTARYRF